MPTMNIKDPEVHRMAHELAMRRNTTATGAVREALQEAIERDDEKRARREGLVERLRALSERSAAIGGTFLTDDDMYDEDGLPK